MSVQSQRIIDQIRIVEYNASYAASLADMWNQSNESWEAAQGSGLRKRFARRWRTPPICMFFWRFMRKRSSVIAALPITVLTRMHYMYRYLTYARITTVTRLVAI